MGFWEFIKDPLGTDKYTNAALDKYYGREPGETAPDGPGIIQKIFTGAGELTGSTVAATIKPLFPMLLITAAVLTAVYVYAKR